MIPLTTYLREYRYVLAETESYWESGTDIVFTGSVISSTSTSTVPFRRGKLESENLFRPPNRTTRSRALNSEARK